MTNSKQQTGVDILFNRFLELFLFHEGIPEELQEAYNIAKEMEKEQIMIAYMIGAISENISIEAVEQYYNKTYGGNK